MRHRILEDALPVVLATRVDLDLGGDHRHHTDDLRLRKPTEIETIGRPRKVIAHTVEAEAEKMLGFFAGLHRFQPAGLLEPATEDSRGMVTMMPC